MRTWEVRDVDGGVLYRGEARTRYAFVHALITEKASFARADMKGFDLSGLDLRRIDFSGARLDDASFRGSQLRGADLRGASLIGARLQGTRLDRARFEGADLTRASLAGARATYADFTGARLDHADFSSVAASGSVFAHAEMEGTDFSGARLVNADFASASVFDCNFSGANLGHHMFGGEEEEVAKELARHLPDRTRGAIVVGCTYDGDTVLENTVPAFRADARTNRLARFGLWAATTLGMLTAGAYMPDLISETALASSLGTGAGAILALGGAYLIKEGVGEWVEDKVKAGLDAVLRRVREAITELDRWGVHRMHLVVAMARQVSAEPLGLALDATATEARQRGFWADFKAFWCGLGQVVICDRRHLAMALGLLSANRNRTCALKRDIVLVRCDGDPERRKAPCVVSFLKDGTTTAIWTLGSGRKLTTRYDETGALAGCFGDDGAEVDPVAAGLPRSHASRLDAAFAFEDSIIEASSLDGFAYPRDTHYLQAGRDGTLFVHRGSDRRLDNPEPGAPAVIKPDDTGIRVRSGSVHEAWSPGTSGPAAA